MNESNYLPHMTPGYSNVHFYTLGERNTWTKWASPWHAYVF